MAWMTMAGITLLLHKLGRGALGPPPLSSISRLATWWRQRGPVLATFAAGREILWWMGCYLLALGALTTLASRRQWAGLLRGLSRCRLPGARTLVRASIGASALVASVLAQTGSSFASGHQDPGEPGDTASPAAPPVLRYAGEAGGTPQGHTGVGPVLRYAGEAGRTPRRSTVVTTQVPRSPGRATPIPGGRSPPATPVRPNTQTPGGQPEGRDDPGVAAPLSGLAGHWTVRPGDSLWSIAEATLAAAWGQPVEPPDLAHYWWRVVEANRRSLPVPSDPDLLFPGDQVVVPAPLDARPGNS